MTIAEAKAGDNRPLWLFDLGDLHIANAPVVIPFNGNDYVPFPVELPDNFGDDQNGPLTDISLKIGCVPTPPYETPILAAYVFNGDLINKTVTVYRLFYDEFYQVIGYETPFVGHVNGDPGIDKDGWITVSCCPHAVNWGESAGIMITRSLFPDMPMRSATAQIFNEQVKFQ